MKKTLLSIFVVAAISASANAQTYTPAPGPISDGEVGADYSPVTINAGIPTSIDISGADILAILPSAVSGVVGGFIDPNDSFPVDVTSTVLTPEGLPGGLSSDCNGCIVNGGSDRDIVISGTPTEDGDFSVTITSATSGSTSIQGFDVEFGGVFTVPVLGQQVQIPPVPGALDSDAYTMSVVDPNSIAEANDVFGLRFYPNPTIGDATLEVNSIEGGVANIEVFSITGSRVFTAGETIRTGLNRIAVDLNDVPAGIYMIRAEINGEQALIRTQKI